MLNFLGVRLRVGMWMWVRCSYKVIRVRVYDVWVYGGLFGGSVGAGWGFSVGVPGGGFGGVALGGWCKCFVRDLYFVSSLDGIVVGCFVWFCVGLIGCLFVPFSPCLFARAWVIVGSSLCYVSGVR